MKRLLPLLAVLGLLLAACGDDDDTTTDDTVEDTDAASEDDTATTEDAAGTDGEPVDASDDEYVAALAADLQEGESFPGTDEQIECLAGGFVEAVGGAEELNAAGISPEELATAESPEAVGLDVDVEQVSSDLVDTFQSCEYDLIALLAESLGPDAPAGFEDCVRAEVSNDELARVFAGAIADPGNQDAIQEILPVLEGCAGTTSSTVPEG